MIQMIVTGVLVIVAAAGLVMGYGYRAATRLPYNNPDSFMASGRGAKKVVVCMGDSITHGRVSHNYVDELAKSRPDIAFVNAGINSQLAYNLLQRLEPVVKCRPDVITILIGTNDAAATLNEENGGRYMKTQHLPRRPDLGWYEENLRAIIQVLQEKTGARIGLLSLPPITEDRTHRGYKAAMVYSRVVRHLAGQHGLAYLPLNEVMGRVLDQTDNQKKSDFVAGDRGLMYQAIFSRYIRGRSWDEISEGNGFVFLTDNLHLNRRGALAAAELIAAFLADSLP